MSFLFHETLARGSDPMARIRGLRVTVCGAGALGANVVETLARSGFERLRVVDRDRVEPRNLSTQPYQRSDVGAQKAKILVNFLLRALKIEVVAEPVELTAANMARLLADCDLVIDTFDNSASRRLVSEHCARAAIPCLHAGLADGYAEILWNEGYRVPSASRDDVCDFPLARNLVLLAVAVTCETVVAYATSGAQNAWTLTLADLQIRGQVP